MTLKQLTELKVGDFIFNNETGLTYLIIKKINNMKYIAIHTCEATNPEQWAKVRD